MPFQVNVNPAEYQKFKEQKKKSSSSGTSSYINEPGQYDLKVIKHEILESRPGREAWKKVSLTLEGAGGKTIRYFFEVPTEQASIVSKYDWMCVYKISNFGEVVGLSETDADDIDAFQEFLGAMSECLGDGSKMKGLSLKAKVGYRGVHSRYGRGADGNPEFRLMGKDGKPMFDKVFPDRDSLIAWVDSNMKNKETGVVPFVNHYVEILNMEPSEEVCPVAHRIRTIVESGENDSPASKQVY